MLRESEILCKLIEENPPTWNLCSTPAMQPACQGTEEIWAGSWIQKDSYPWNNPQTVLCKSCCLTLRLPEWDSHALAKWQQPRKMRMVPQGSALVTLTKRRTFSLLTNGSSKTSSGAGMHIASISSGVRWTWLCGKALLRSMCHCIMQNGTALWTSRQELAGMVQQQHHPTTRFARVQTGAYSRHMNFEGNRESLNSWYLIKHE